MIIDTDVIGNLDTIYPYNDSTLTVQSLVASNDPVIYERKYLYGNRLIRAVLQ